MGKRNRYHSESSLVLTPEGISLTEQIINDKDYEKKIADLMAMMQGKRIAGRQQLGSIVNRGD